MAAENPNVDQRVLDLATTFRALAIQVPNVNCASDLS